MRISILAMAATLLAIAAMVSCTGKSHIHSTSLPEAELEDLDLAISHASDYAARAHRPIDSILQVARSTKDHRHAFDLYVQATHQLSVLDADSALEISQYALTEAQTIGNDSMILLARIARLSALTSAGIFNLAEEELLNLQNLPMTKRHQSDFWQVGRQLYAYMYVYSMDNYEVSEIFRKKNMQYDDSLLTVLKPNNPFRRFIMCERMVVNGNYRQAKLSLDSLLHDTAQYPHLYGMAAFQMALVHKALGDDYNYGTWITRSATSDVRTGVREGLALFNLANWLYSKGEVADAFHYINHAMREAMAGHARMRAGNIASMLPMIDETYRQSNKDARDRLTFFAVISTLLLLITATMLFMLFYQRRRSLISSEKLRALSMAQEAHLANFLALCSTYYHRLHSLEMLVRRKIASGQTDELLKGLKSGRYTEGKDEDIFEIFDRSFLEIYPDFIEQINGLLRPEERYSDHGTNVLHNELRIYALVKMGITESTRIAQILNYSVNTVYAYRNKMRNKAVDRDNFEADIANLAATDRPNRPNSSL